MTITLKDVGSGFKRTAINENFETIETTLNSSVLLKDGSQQLESDLDANSNKVINLARGVAPSDAVTFAQLSEVVEGSGTLATDTSAINHVEGSTNYDLDLYLQNRHVLHASDFGASVSSSPSVNTLAIQEALDTGAIDSTVILPEGIIKIDGLLTLNKQQHIKGQGRKATILQVTSDVVAIHAKFSFCNVSDMTVTTDGVTAHTKDLIQIGQVGGGGRTVVDNVIAKLAGQDGVHLINGNLTVFRDVTATSNGRDGIHLSLEDVDSNACVFDGIVDCNGNGRDGVHLADAISSGDALAPSTCTGNIIAQNNGRYGVNVGSHKNALTIYAETNTTEDIHFGAEARGNMITVVEATTFNDASANGNQISFHNLDTLKVRGFLWPVRMNEGFIVGESSLVGFSELKQTGNQDYTFAVDGTSSNQVLNFANNRSGFTLNVNFEGGASPTGDNLYSLGDASNRWNRIRVNKINAGDGDTDWTSGTGTPEGNVTAPTGSLFTSSSTGLLYVKQTGTGNTGWIAK